MRLTARTWGDGDPVMLLHGIPGSSGIWTGVGERLADEFHAIAPDLLGFGGSPGEPDPETVWTDAQARAVAALADGMGIERLTLVGHDYGGPVALTLAALRPQLVTRIVLCATNAFPDVPIPMPIRAVTWPLIGDAAARVLFSTPSLRMMVRQGFAGDSPELDHRVWFGGRRQQAVVRTIFTLALRELRERYAPIERSLRGLGCPALVVWAGHDPFFAVEQGRRTADAIPDGRLVLYEDCGHYLPAEQPERLAADIAAFVRHEVPA
jgi:pimeloyl-ACP methyl ester carboxylesterase